MYLKAGATLAMAAWLAGASHAVAQVDSTVQAQEPHSPSWQE